MVDQALAVVRTLQEHGYEALYAGGYVRDMVLGLESHDVDVATSAGPNAVEKLFEKTLAVGKSFGVIVVVMDEVEIEVATFRNDGNYSDGRRPDSVVFSSKEEDAKRRDLTINGMFYDPIKREILDYVGGQEDLKRRVIRLIGDPEARIAEDKLRMLRVVRFATRLDFTIAPDTLEAVKRHSAEITQISAERVADELQKILRAGNYQKSLNLLFDIEIIKHILPEIFVMRGCEQPVDYHPEGDVLVHTIKALENIPTDASDELRMGTLLHDVGKPAVQTIEDRIRFNRHELKGKDIAREILKRLKFSNEFIDRVLSLVENHMKFMAVKDMRTSRLKRFIALPHFEEHMALHRADCLSSHENLDNYEFVREKMNTYEPEEIRPVRIITGTDLLGMGYKAGPLFKQILTDVEDRQLEGIITDRDGALKYVSETYQVV
jgi:poly(A) polymerase